MDRVVQPVKEAPDGSYFDQFPTSAFDVVVISSGERAHRYGVSEKQRADLLRASGNDPGSVVSSEVATHSQAPKHVRILVQGEGAHVAIAISVLQTELRVHGIDTALTKRGEPYDYTVVFAEGDRDAASALALDGHSNEVASAVRAAFTASGAVGAASRDLAKKLEPLIGR